MKIDKYHQLPIFHFASELQKRHNRKQVKALIMGNFGAMNLGDEAILAGQIQELKKIKDITITVVARHPQEIKLLHKTNAVSMYEFNKLRKCIKRSDIIIVGGGGLINKIERGLFGFLYQLYMLLTYFYLPRIYRKKLYILGVGMYSNANSFIISLVLPILRYASIVTVRDHHSYEFLKNKNVRVFLYKDNSYLMDLLPKKELLADEFIKKHFHDGRNNIGISLVKPDLKADEKHLIEEVAKYIAKHHDNTDFWYYPADTNPSYLGDDKLAQDLLEEVKKVTSDEINLYMIPKTYSPQFFFSTIKLMQGFIGMRFHTLLFAYRENVPFVGISYDSKCKSFIEAVGRKPLFFKKFTAEELHKNMV